VIYFASDSTDGKVIHRIDGLMKLGFNVVGCSYRRDKYNREFTPFWNNIDLGIAADHAYARRILGLFAGLCRLWLHRRTISDADLILARNIDMAVLAFLARALASGRAPVVYEVLDVHRFFLGDRLLNRTLRILERWVLRRSAALIVSSPAFVSEYFQPMQNYRGRWFLLENRVPAAAARRRGRTSTSASRGRGQSWVIAWSGTLRCLRSLDILVAVARRNRGRVEIHMRGRPTELELAAFLERIEDEPNVFYGGPYKSPDDLADVYASVDLNWCIDLYDAGKNSDWLLPNRLYEGGAFSVPALALSGTETARVVSALGTGWVLAEPLVESLTALLTALTPETYAARRQRFAKLPPETFVETNELERVCAALLASSDH
jgi:succinoglycan biosynthesis protein ExoL